MNETAYLNWKKSLEINAEKSRERGLQRAAEYNLNPKKCYYCNISLSYNQRKQKFCSLLCSNSTLKKKAERKIDKIFNDCYICSESIKTGTFLCSPYCHGEYRYIDYIFKWKQNINLGYKGLKVKSISQYVRRYIFEKYDSKCCECGWNKIHSKTGRIPLQVDHVDGDVTNNREENLRLLCPNCHSLTSNYGTLNKGNSKRYSDYTVKLVKRL